METRVGRRNGMLQAGGEIKGEEKAGERTGTRGRREKLVKQESEVGVEYGGFAPQKACKNPILFISPHDNFTTQMAGSMLKVFITL